MTKTRYRDTAGARNGTISRYFWWCIAAELGPVSAALVLLDGAVPGDRVCRGLGASDEVRRWDLPGQQGADLVLGVVLELPVPRVIERQKGVVTGELDRLLCRAEGTAQVEAIGRALDHGQRPRGLGKVAPTLPRKGDAQELFAALHVLRL